MSCGNPFKHVIEAVKEIRKYSQNLVEFLFKGTIGAIWFLIMKLILMRLITRMNACSLVTARWTTKKTLNKQEV